MKRVLKKKPILIGGGLTLFIALFVYISFDIFYGGGNFRTTQDPISSTQYVNLIGLRDLHASGSAPMRFSDLKKRLSHIPGPKIIVDGMAEFHGYIKGIPTTFFAYQRKSPNVKHILRRLIFTGTTSVRPDLVIPEAEEAKKYGFDYIKLTIGSKFIASDENIDEIIDFFENLPSNSWLHFHCAQGKGRTSILLMLLDIVKNAPQVSLEHLAKRHRILGSENLMTTDVRKNGTYTKKQLEERMEFLTKVYSFIVEKKAGGIQRWSDWNRKWKLDHSEDFKSSPLKG